MIEFEVKGLMELQGKLRHFTDTLTRDLFMEGQRAAYGMQAYARTERMVRQPGPPVAGILTARHGGGGFSGSIQVTHEISGPNMTFHVGINESQTASKYARIHEFGGTITGHPWLRFPTFDGSWHTVRTVTIPPRPVFGPTYEAMKDKVPKGFEVAVVTAERRAGLI